MFIKNILLVLFNVTLTDNQPKSKTPFPMYVNAFLLSSEDMHGNSNGN